MVMSMYQDIRLLRTLQFYVKEQLAYPLTETKRGAVAFLTVKDNQVDWDVNRYEYDKEKTTEQLESRKPPFYTNLKNTINKT